MFPHSATLDETTVDVTAEAAASEPLKVFRFRGVSASVLANPVEKDGLKFNIHNVSLQQTYKVDGEFKHSSSFDRDQLSIAGHLLQQV